MQFSWFAEVLHDQFYLTAGEAVGMRRRVQFTQFLAQFGAVVDPVVQVVHGPLLRLSIGEIEHGQFRLAVTADLERLEEPADADRRRSLPEGRGSI